MSEKIGKKRSKKRGKSKNKEFMDAALDAFIRDQSLKKWNEVEGLRSGAEIDSLEAVKSSSNMDSIFLSNSFLNSLRSSSLMKCGTSLSNFM